MKQECRSVIWNLSVALVFVFALNLSAHTGHKKEAGTTVFSFDPNFQRYHRDPTDGAITSGNGARVRTGTG